MINPVKFTRFEPFRSYQKLSKLYQALEEKYGLSIDHGVKDPPKTVVKINEKAKSFESYTT
jgi:hypothetical protein